MQIIPTGACLGAGAREDIVPIPGTKRVKYLEENVGEIDVKLTSEDLAQIEKILAQGGSSRTAL